jgi:hypothetical protein
VEAYPDDANGRVLSGMRASGANMAARYAIDFEHIFPDLQTCEEFVRRIAGRGRRVEKSEYTGRSGYYWQVRVTVRMVPTYAGITRVEQELAAVADACGGCPDGWGILA